MMRRPGVRDNFIRHAGNREGLPKIAIMFLSSSSKVAILWGSPNCQPSLFICDMAPLAQTAPDREPPRGHHRDGDF